MSSHDLKLPVPNVCTRWYVWFTLPTASQSHESIDACEVAVKEAMHRWRCYFHLLARLMLPFVRCLSCNLCSFQRVTDQHHPRIRSLKGEFKNHEVILLKIVNTCVMIQMIENKIIASLERGHPLWISRLFDCFKYANGYACLLSASIPYEYVLSVFMY